MGIFNGCIVVEPANASDLAASLGRHLGRSRGGPGLGPRHDRPPVVRDRLLAVPRDGLPDRCQLGDVPPGTYATDSNLPGAAARESPQRLTWPFLLLR